MPYSDLCREKILSEDYHDFIVSDIRMPFLQDMLEKDCCLQNPGFFYQCAYLSKSVIKPVSLENYSYFSIPKCYSLLSMQALNQAGILPIQNHSTIQLSGKQVMIGFLSLRYCFACFNFTTAITDSGAAPINCASGSPEPAAILARNVPCPLLSTLGTREYGSSEASASLIISGV